MKTIKMLLSASLILVAIHGCISGKDETNPIFTEIIHEFDTHQIVAIGESHGWKEESEFIFKLINDSSFSRQVNDIVVECGNAGYQSLMDDYVNGKDIPDTDLQQVWRNMTVLCTCDAPVYKQLFETVRTVNQRSGSLHRVRVLLGEPPVNWKKINKTEDLGPWIFQRDEYYAGVVEKEVIQKNRRALLIMGSLHFIKKGWGIDPQAGNNAPMAFNNADPGDTSGGTFMKSAPVPSKNEAGKISIKKIEEPNNTNSNKQAPNVAQILEKKYPGKLFIILPYDGYGDMVANKEIEEKLDPKKPSLLITGNSWPGNMEAGRLYGRRSLALTNGKVTGEVIYDPYPNLKISDLCDAFLYISDRKNMARSLPVNIYSDTAYIKELNRRSIIMNGNPFKLSDYTDTSLKIHTF